MKLFRVFLSLVLAFSALHAVGSSSDDDVLLLTQISRHYCLKKMVQQMAQVQNG